MIFDSQGKKIPKAKYYVFMVDKFLSSFDRAPQMKGDKKSLIILPLNSLEDAQLAQKNAENSSDMTNIRIDDNPDYDENRYHATLKTKEEMTRFF